MFRFPPYHHSGMECPMCPVDCRQFPMVQAVHWDCMPYTVHIWWSWRLHPRWHLWLGGSLFLEIFQSRQSCSLQNTVLQYTQQAVSLISGTQGGEERFRNSRVTLLGHVARWEEVAGEWPYSGDILVPCKTAHWVDDSYHHSGEHQGQDSNREPTNYFDCLFLNAWGNNNELDFETLNFYPVRNCGFSSSSFSMVSTTGSILYMWIPMKLVMQGLVVSGFMWSWPTKLEPPFCTTPTRCMKPLWPRSKNMLSPPLPITSLLTHWKFRWLQMILPTHGPKRSERPLSKNYDTDVFNFPSFLLVSLNVWPMKFTVTNSRGLWHPAAFQGKGHIAKLPQAFDQAWEEGNQGPERRVQEKVETGPSQRPKFSLLFGG